jgi:hypothetical protein
LWSRLLLYFCFPPAKMRIARNFPVMCLTVICLPNTRVVELAQRFLQMIEEVTYTGRLWIRRNTPSAPSSDVHVQLLLLLFFVVSLGTTFK